MNFSFRNDSTKIVCDFISFKFYRQLFPFKPRFYSTFQCSSKRKNNKVLDALIQTRTESGIDIMVFLFNERKRNNWHFTSNKWEKSFSSSTHGHVPCTIRRKQEKLLICSRKIWSSSRIEFNIQITHAFAKNVLMVKYKNTINV